MIIYNSSAFKPYTHKPVFLELNFIVHLGNIQDDTSLNIWFKITIIKCVTDKALQEQEMPIFVIESVYFLQSKCCIL